MLPQSIRHGLRRLFHKEDVERDLHDEVQHYLEQAAGEHLRRGASPDAAARAARLEFGGVEAAKEEVRTSGWESGIESVLQDVRYALRSLRRSPAFTAVAIATLAIGIGATTSMFSVVNAVMLRPLPYADPSRLVMLWTDDPQRGLRENATPYITTGDWRSQNRSLSDLAIFAPSSSLLIGGGIRERVGSSFVSGNLFSVLGVRPLMGSAISEADDRGFERVVVISYELWQRRFAGDASIIGKMLELQPESKGGPPPSRIIGVMPKAFYFPDRETQLWVPATLYWRWRREAGERFIGSARRWSVVARMKPGMTSDEVRTDMNSVAARLTRDHKTSVPDFPGFAVNTVPILDQFTGRTLQQALWILLGAVGLVLLIACANVANLLLARGAARSHEFALRQALGASRIRLVRQVLVESSILAIIAGSIGVLFAVVATRLLASSAAARLPRLAEIPVDGMVLGFAAAIALLAGVTFGMAPALRWSRANADALKEGGRQSVGGRRLRGIRGTLLTAECAVAFVLLIGAGLLLRSFARVMTVDPGFKPEGVLSVRVDIPSTPPSTGPELQATTNIDKARALQREERVTRLVERLRLIPGVRGVAVTSDLFIRDNADRVIFIPGRDPATVPSGELNEANVSAGFFETMGVPLIRGRYPTRGDAFRFIDALWAQVPKDLPINTLASAAIAEPVVVNESFVRRYYPGEDPIGKRFVDDPTVKPFWYEIVGVVGDMRRQGLEHDAIPELFGPFFPTTGAEFLVRTDRDPLLLADAVRRVALEEYPGAMILSATSVERRMGEFAEQRKLQTTLLGLFAGIALLLAVIGIFGVVQYSVAERTREIGVRVALGATSKDVVRLVVRESMWRPMLGAAIGLIAALGATRIMSHLLFGIEATDPATFTVVVLVLMSAAFLACYIPARRATRIDPAMALRTE